MGKRIRKSDPSSREHRNGRHKFEHWYVDRTVYFLTARVREGLFAFEDPACQTIFWSKFDQYTRAHQFDPWIATLLVNHYHVVGFAQNRVALGQMMRKLHGSIAWLICKHLDIQHKPFWRDSASNDYMDGCLRSEKQLEDSYLYVRNQSVKARLVKRWEDDPNTRVMKPLEDCLTFARENDALLKGVPYPRYERRNRT